MALKLFRIHAKNMGKHYEKAPNDTYYKTEWLKTIKNFLKVFGDEFEKNLLQKVLLKNPYPN